jgi:LemA protein
MISALVLIVLAVLFIAIVVGMYNRLVTLRNRFKNAFSQIDVQLKRRYDLIPNLVETAKAYMKHEKETFEAVIAARSRATEASQKAAQNPADANSIKGLMGAEAALTGALGKLFALAEAYPDLKANQTMAQLTEELTSTENKISFARQGYNDAVTLYNTACQKFPAVIIANVMGFSEAQLFEIEAPKEREAPKVSFN